MPATAPPPARPGTPELLKWSRAISRGVRKDYRFLRGQQEEFDLEQTAALALVKAALAYDVEKMAARNGIAIEQVDAGGFKGYASRYIRGECVREARRLRNGGTYHTRRERAGDGTRLVRIEVEHLSRRLTADGTPKELPDPRTLAPDDEPGGFVLPPLYVTDPAA